MTHLADFAVECGLGTVASDAHGQAHERLALLQRMDQHTNACIVLLLLGNRHRADSLSAVRHRDCGVGVVREQLANTSVRPVEGSAHQRWQLYCAGFLRDDMVRIDARG